MRGIDLNCAGGHSGCLRQELLGYLPDDLIWIVEHLQIGVPQDGSKAPDDGILAIKEINPLARSRVFGCAIQLDRKQIALVRIDNHEVDTSPFSGVIDERVLRYHVLRVNQCNVRKNAVYEQRFKIGWMTEPFNMHALPLRPRHAVLSVYGVIHRLLAVSPVDEFYPRSSLDALRGLRAVSISLPSSLSLRQAMPAPPCSAPARAQQARLWPPSSDR